MKIISIFVVMLLTLVTVTGCGDRKMVIHFQSSVIQNLIVSRFSERIISSNDIVFNIMTGN